PAHSPLAGDSLFFVRSTDTGREATVFNAYSLSMERCELPTTHTYVAHYDRLIVREADMPVDSCGGLITDMTSFVADNPDLSQDLAYPQGALVVPQRSWESGMASGLDVVWREREPRHFDVIPLEAREESTHTDHD